MTTLRSVKSASEGSMIDVDFEHGVRVLRRAWESFPDSSGEDTDYHRLCRALRDAKVYYTDIDRWYRTGYDTSALETLVSGISKAIPDMARSRYLRSIRRHVKEILRIVEQRANPRRRGAAIYAAS